jgi:Mg-chelatase subunit ChlD
MGAVSRPQQLTPQPWLQSSSGELDLESTLEHDPYLSEPIVEEKTHKRAEVIVCIDTSLSMTGKKLALTAVSLAVIALQLEPEDLSIVAFEADAAVLKPLGSVLPLPESLKRFLEVPARGLTNIEAGLIKAISESQKGRLRRKAVILMTDGRFTAGKNPEYLIKKLPRLHVVQTGNPWSSPRFCRTLARIGGGKHIRISKPEHLPKALYSLVHEIIR